SSYSAYYRRMLPKLLGALEFRCNNAIYRPVMDALELLARYAERRGAGAVLRRRGAGPVRRGGAPGVARRGRRRGRPGGAGPLRAVRVAGLAGSRPPPGGLCVRGEPRA